MNDIFISFSSEDLEIAKQICQFFEQKKLKCWISCRIQDLHSGEGYIQRIREEICSSKNFLLLLSKSSIMSGQVLQEIAVANDRQKYGLENTSKQNSNCSDKCDHVIYDCKHSGDGT